MIHLPQTSKGALIALGAIAVVLIWFYATTLLTVAMGAVLVAMIVYAIYVIGVRVNRFFRDKRILGGNS